MAQPMSATARPQGPSEPPLTPLSGMPRRIGRQLALILLGGLIVLALQIAVDMGFEGTTSATTVALPVAIVLVSLAAWALTAYFAPYADPLFVTVASLISGIGIVFIRRINYQYDDNAIEPDTGLFAGIGGRQLIYLMIGVALFGVFLAVVRNHRVMRGYAYILLFAGIGLAALPGFLPYSISGSDGSKNWIKLGGLSVQPSEFAKLMLLIFFAVYLVRKRDVLGVAGPRILGLQFPRMKDLGPIVIVWAASLLILIFERDLGTSLLLFGMFLAMLYIATRRVSWIVIGLTLFIGGCVAIYPFFSHLQLRVQIWLDPFNPDYVDNQSYQLVTGLVGMNDGGLLGNGPGQGRPDLLPAAESDFILSVVGEETGLFGIMALLVLYGMFIERGFKTAVMSRDLFGKLMAGGMAFLVAFQLFVVCGGITGLIPLTGQTTPFLAMGGSSLIGSWLLCALLVRVSDDARKPWQASYGLHKTEAPPEFLAEQAAKRAAEEAAAVGGPVPGGDQKTELIIPASLEGPSGEQSGQAPSPGAPPPESSPPSTGQSPPRAPDSAYGPPAGPGPDSNGMPPGKDPRQ
ncbi:FtsW/RodA/SpoVE family cell cycle protein [Glycomyces halotolerans]